MLDENGFETLDATKPSDVIFQELQSHIVNHGLQKVGTSLETNGAVVPLDQTGSAAQQKKPKSASQRKH